MKPTVILWAACAGMSIPATGTADTTLMHYEPPQSVLTTTGDPAGKPRLLQLSYEAPGGGFLSPLVCFFTVEEGPDVRDLHGTAHAARDIFAARSLDGGQTWTSPINCSGTAHLSSMSTDHDGDPETAPIPYCGDSSKPMVFASGRNIILAWTDRYSPTTTQRSVVYDHDGIRVEVPYAALYLARSIDGGETWLPAERITDGSRDAILPMPRGNANGWAVTWQEDPQGLQPGEAEGPGDGGSGAKVTKGSDIWYSSLTTAEFTGGTSFPPGRRLTDNFTHMGEGVNEGFESGVAGASRANLALVGPTAIVAYEETKGTGGEDFGKLVRYHVFSAFDESAPDPTARVGWIVSNPDENARRVRIVAQSQSGPATGLKLVLLFRQGCYGEGGPADVIARVGLGGFTPGDLHPPVDPDCMTHAGALRNEAGVNISSSLGLDAATDDDAYEDARAHRAVIRGDFIMVGYSWSPDWAVARYTDLENYDFFVRRSEDGAATWEESRNMSKLSDSTVSVYEPRLVATPKSADPDDPRNTNALVVAWGTAQNQYDHMSERTLPIDVLITRTTDRGETYEPVQVLAGGPAMQSALQLRTSAAGDRIFAVWLEESETGSISPMFRWGEARERLLGDVNLDGWVNFDDLAIVLGTWGPCDNCLGDFNANGIVDFTDLTTVLAKLGTSAP